MVNAPNTFVLKVSVLESVSTSSIITALPSASMASTEKFAFVFARRAGKANVMVTGSVEAVTLDTTPFFVMVYKSDVGACLKVCFT